MQRILVVDDDQEILAVIQYILEDSGYQVDTLSDGHNLLKTIHDKKPDLVLLDIMLGDMDGRELCRHLKTSQLTNHIPVIMVSASHQVTNFNGADGPNDFISKPFDINDLLTTVQRQLVA